VEEVPLAPAKQTIVFLLTGCSQEVVERNPISVRVPSSSTSCSLVNLTGGIVQDGDQVVILAVRKPGVLAGIGMQQHPR
jgi:hypothetical protein